MDFSKTVDCCVVGEASKCIQGNTNGQAEYCINAITPSKSFISHYPSFRTSGVLRNIQRTYETVSLILPI